MSYQFRAFPLRNPIEQSPDKGPTLEFAVYASSDGGNWQPWTYHTTWYDAKGCVDALESLQAVLTPTPPSSTLPSQLLGRQPTEPRNLDDETARREFEEAAKAMREDPNRPQYLKDELASVDWSLLKGLDRN